MVMTSGEYGLDKLKRIRELSNNLHSRIEREMRYSTKKLEFLDVFVNIENGQLKNRYKDMFRQSILIL